MYLRRNLYFIFLVTAITLPGCGGGSTQSLPSGPAGPTASPGPTFVTTSTADPVGDANMTLGGTPWDITQVATSRLAIGATSLTITTTFAQAISSADLPAPGSGATTGAQLAVVLLISTGSGGGVATIASCVGSPTFAHVNYAVNATNMRLADGNFPVISFNGASPTQTGEAAISVSGPNAITYTVPISAIGGGSGAIQLEVAGGNGKGPTDCAPNSTYIST